MKRFLLILYSLLLLLGCGSKIFGQVSIGVGEPPVGGSLLQIKSIEGVTGAGANSNKGLLMPRVNLTDINMLYPMFIAGYNKTIQDPIHAGLVVFNTNNNLPDSNGIGLYCWDGQSWGAMTKERSTLEISPNALILSEIKTSNTAKLTLSRNGQAWEMSTSGVEASSTVSNVQNGKIVNLTFTRTITPGDKVYTFRLVEKPEVTAQIRVSNLELKINKETFRVGEGSVNGVVNSSTAVEPIGGDAKWEVLDYSKDTFNWTVPPKNEGGRLMFELGAVKSATASVFGQIRVRHSNEPGLIRTIKVEQNKEYRVLPSFDFMVIKYGPGRPINGDNVDIDSATEILKSNVPAVDKRPVGFVGKTIEKESANGIDYMFYAGDDRTSGSETSYVNIPKLNEILVKYPSSSNQIEIGMSAWWYENESNVTNATVTISLYKGGEMTKVGTTYENRKDGKVQQPLLQFASGSKYISVNSDLDQVDPNNYKTKYTPMFKLEYDRKDNTGVLIQWRNWE